MLNKLGKLLKYEFRFYFRIFPLIYLLIILLALIVRFHGFLSSDYYTSGISLLTSLRNVIIVAMSVVTIIFIIQRYTDNFLKDSGSLMFSLPVTVFALLASKTIAAFCMFLLGFLSIVISIIITEGIEGWKGADISFISAVFSGILNLLCLFYMVTTISYKLPRFRNQAAFAMFFFIMYLQQFISSIFIGTIGLLNIYVKPMPTSISTLIFAAIYFSITWYLLKRSYNLE